MGLDGRNTPVTQTFDWKRFYPDAMAQAFPILMEVQPPGSGRAQYLYRELTGQFPPAAMEGDLLLNAGMLALLAAQMGDADTARKYLDIHRQAFCQSGQGGRISCQVYALGLLAASILQAQSAGTAACTA